MVRNIIITSVIIYCVSDLDQMLFIDENSVTRRVLLFASIYILEKDVKDIK